MTGHTPDDEVLSALLDAEPVGASAAHVAGCSDCQNRLSELRAAARLAATPPPHAPRHVREAAVARAVAAASSDHVEGRIAAVTSLRGRRRQKPLTAPRRNIAPLPAAAALVALIVAAGFMFNLTTGGGDRRNDNAAFSQGPPSGGAVNGADSALTNEGAALEATADSAAETGLGATQSPTPGSVTEPVPGRSAAAAVAAIPDGGELGDVDTIEEITRRAESDLAAHREGGGERPCRSKASEGGRIEWQAGVNFKSTPAVAYVITDSANARVTQVWSTAECSLLARQAA